MSIVSTPDERDDDGTSAREKRVGRALSAYVEHRAQQLARKVIWKLQREGASKFQLEGRGRTLWEVYCADVWIDIYGAMPGGDLRDVIRAFAECESEAMSEIERNLLLAALDDGGITPAERMLIDMVEETVRDRALSRSRASNR